MVGALFRMLAATLQARRFRDERQQMHSPVSWVVRRTHILVSITLTVSYH